MKILFLNHHIDAKHKICLRLQSTGAAVLFPVSVDEAWKMIQVHGSSLDLAVIHREARGSTVLDEGVQLVSRIKADPRHADLPIILSSSQWGDHDFVQHQQGPLGAHAYLRWPFDAEELISTIEKMFGSAVGGAHASSVAEATAVSKQLPETLAGLSVVLEEAGPGLGESFDQSVAGQLQLDSSHLPGFNETAPPDLKNTPAPFEVGEIASGEIKLELSPSPATGLNLGEGTVVQRFDLPVEQPPPSAFSLDASVENPPLTAEGTLDISSIMDEDLEPHERLERKQRHDHRAGVENSSEATLPSIALQTPQALVQSDEGGLQAADPGAHEAGSVAPSDEAFAGELPYLFSSNPAKDSDRSATSAWAFSEAVGDAVVPGGAVHSPDIETLKKYLLLREQDVAILSNQLKSAKEQLNLLDRSVKDERGKGLELSHVVAEQGRRIEDFEKEKANALQGLQTELEELTFQHRTKTDKVRLLEAQVREAADEIEHLKERVRGDIRKIRVREKELENKLEIVKKDSEALITTRETKIMELKRKIDLLEFNMDLLQDQYAREKENSAQLRERLARAAQVVRVAGGLLGSQKDDGEKTSIPLGSEPGAERKAAREAS